LRITERLASAHECRKEIKGARMSLAKIIIIYLFLVTSLAAYFWYVGKYPSKWTKIINLGLFYLFYIGFEGFIVKTTWMIFSDEPLGWKILGTILVAFWSSALLFPLHDRLIKELKNKK
jgi:hypothetical protein